MRPSRYSGPVTPSLSTLRSLEKNELSQRLHFKNYQQLLEKGGASEMISAVWVLKDISIQILSCIFHVSFVVLECIKTTNTMHPFCGTIHFLHVLTPFCLSIILTLKTGPFFDHLVWMNAIWAKVTIIVAFWVRWVVMMRFDGVNVSFASVCRRYSQI